MMENMIRVTDENKACSLYFLCFTLCVPSNFMRKYCRPDIWRLVYTASVYFWQRKEWRQQGHEILGKLYLSFYMHIIKVEHPTQSQLAMGGDGWRGVERPMILYVGMHNFKCPMWDFLILNTHDHDLLLSSLESIMIQVDGVCLRMIEWIQWIQR